ncbi:Cytochrome b2, mitochondrial precursor [Yamadazyma tenuis]|nr:Cytochrome b2, mitochondrial precursor [Yamadazyma tenuis]
MKYAGKDASKLFNRLHPSNVIETFLDEAHVVGEIDMPPDSAISEEEIIAEKLRIENLKRLPKVNQIYNINDFEAVARAVLPPHAWAYYNGGSDDEVTMRENHYAFHKFFFLPKILVDVRNVDISTTMLGTKTSAPFYCSAAALAQLGHPDGELSISRGCGTEDVIQMISSTASYSFDEILDETKPGQSHWFQLYVKPDRKHSIEMLKKCAERNVKGIFVTVDTPMLGKREKDFKFRYGEDGPNDDDDPITSYDDPGLTWADIDAFKKVSDIPIAIKGVQRSEDVLLAVEHGVDAVVLSNHGGRQLDFSRAPVDVLAEVMPILRAKNLDKKIEIYIDGGIRRGTDVIKALCLGAKGVGLGRAFLYANSCYGEEGVKKAVQLLKHEIALNMKFMGVTKIEDLNSSMIEKRDSYGFHRDSIYDANYETMRPIGLKDIPTN